MNVSEWIKKIESHFSRRLYDFALESDRNDTFPQELVDYILADADFRQVISHIDRYENQWDFYKIIYGISYDFAALASILLTQVVNGIYPMMRFGSDLQQEKYLKPLIQGELMGAFAYSEDGQASYVKHLATKLRKTDQGWVINGQKHQVSNGNEAQIFYLLVELDKEEGSERAIFLIDRETEGLTVSPPLEKVGIRGMSLSEINLENVYVKEDQLLAGSFQGQQQFKDIFRFLKMAIISQALALAKAMLDKGIAYFSIDRNIGKRLIELDGIQEKLAMHEAQLDVLLSYFKEIIQNKSKSEEDIAKLKLLASNFAQQATNEVLNMTGGFGFMKQNDLDRIARDASATSLYGGSRQSQTRIICKKWL